MRIYTVSDILRGRFYGLYGVGFALVVIVTSMLASLVDGVLLGFQRHTLNHDSLRYAVTNGQTF